MGERGRKSKREKRAKHKLKKKTETEVHKGSIEGETRRILRL